MSTVYRNGLEMSEPATVRGAPKPAKNKIAWARTKVKLSKDAPTSKFNIRKIIWSTRSIGIAAHRVTENNEIKIEDANKDGEPHYPGTYHITQASLESGVKNGRYKVQELRANIKVIVVPIKDLNLLVRE